MKMQQNKISPVIIYLANPGSTIYSLKKGWEERGNPGPLTSRVTLGVFLNFSGLLILLKEEPLATFHDHCED